MRRPLCTVIAAFVLFTSLLKAQESKSPSFESGVLSTSGDAATITMLLQQSHDISQQLPVRVRLTNLLPRQAELVSELRPDLGLEWANELFALSSQAKASQRTPIQNTAIGMLVRLNRDPSRALELLHSLNIEEPVPKWASTPPEMGLVNRLFDQLVQRDGASALPTLEQEADRLGMQGYYPYSALGYAAMQSTTKYWGNDNQHAVRILNSVFEPAFTRYSQNPHRYYDDFEFGQMLQVLAGGLPFDSVQPALRTLVKNLLATDTSKYQFELEGYSSGGKAVKVHNTIDATILHFGSLINRDPELAQQLESTRPELQGALEYTQGEWLHSERFHSKWPYSESKQQQTSRDAVSLSLINPEAAIAKAEELPDDQRAGPMLDLARNIAGDYPQRAAELIAEIQSGNTATDDEMSVNLVSAQAFVAAAQNNKEDLQKLVRRGLESAYRAILEQQRTGDMHFFNGLGALVQLAGQNDLDLTITFIQRLPPSYLKAELLLAAATDLSKPVRLPVRYRPQQRAEKSDVTP